MWLFYFYYILNSWKLYTFSQNIIVRFRIFHEFLFYIFVKYHNTLSQLFYLFLFHLSFYYISYSWKLQHTLTNLFLFCFFSLNLLLYFEYSHNLSFCSYFQKIFIKIFEIMHFSRTTLYIFNSWKLQHILSQIIIYSFVSIFQKILFCEISNFSRIYIYIKITISLYFLVKNLLFLKTLLLSCIYTFFIIRFL